MILVLKETWICITKLTVNLEEDQRDVQKAINLPIISGKA